MLKQVLEQFISQNFTFENVKKFRDFLINQLKIQVAQTETAVDDWGVELVEKLLDDKNLERIYSWVVVNGRLILTNQCLSPQNSLGTLASKMVFVEDNVCGTPDLASVISFLEIIVPILIEWLKK